MSEYANVSLRTLRELNDGLASNRSRLQQSHAEIDRQIDGFFREFERMKDVLNERLKKAEEELAEAQRKLSDMESRKHWVEGKDGRGGRWSPDTTAQEFKVRNCRMKRDICRNKLVECRSIIESCAVKRKFIKGTYNVIDQSLNVSLNDLRTDINSVENYQNDSSAASSAPTYREASSAVFSPRTDTARFNAEGEVIRHQFFGKDNKALANANITIVDNKLFGFGDIRLVTDDKGYVTMPFVDTDNCSIYIDNEEVYNGKLYANMEYNRNGDGRMTGTPDNSNHV